MSENLLEGIDESPGVVISRNGQKVKVARGMASREAALDPSLHWLRISGTRDVPNAGVTQYMPLDIIDQGILPHEYDSRKRRPNRGLVDWRNHGESEKRAWGHRISRCARDMPRMSKTFSRPSG